MFDSSQLRWTTLLAITVALPQTASANGYQNLHQSADGMATAYATNGAGGDDISAIFSNPASLSRFPGINAAFNATVIAPRSEMSDIEALSYGTAVDGAPDTPEQVLDTSFSAATYLGWQVNDQLTFGVAFTAPWATVSDYPNTAASRYIATDTDLRALNIAPMVSWQATPELSVAAALNIQHYSADFSVMTDSNVPSGGTGGDILSEVTGTDFALGYTLGVEWERGPTRIGLSYRSKIEHDFDGDIEMSGGDVSGLEGILGNAVVRNGSADFTIATPWIATLGIAHQATPKLELYGSAMLVGWSAFGDTVVSYDNGLPTTTVRNGWDDKTYVALGLGYQYNSDIKFRGGFAYDPTPTPDDVRNPRAPNADRLYIGAGVSWQAREDLQIDFSWAHTFFDTAKIDLDNGNGNTLKGDIDVDADIFMIQIAKRW
ncbi:outer membrane protein transport protein [Sulfitobacter sp. D35]|uniref:OmpP1/FadL family transporter n=1 Tax=Sulfitobacter sp. D35 TaxID=3083252 RepID=UPI00296FB26F|nr:outer membrane protein transport protein [Sulfitobacter sp. D35]MDW4498779.1 outer membrane protein transport protein [Sulfitobacter sp. D35]